MRLCRFLSKKACAVFLVYVATAIASPAQIFTSLASFDITNGSNPYLGSLVQSTDGNFYGTTLGNTIFKITPAGTLTPLYSFCAQTDCTDGRNPAAGLVQAIDGNFYGTTTDGGTNNGGTVFKITPGGTLTTLYNFCAQANCTDGLNPYGALVQAGNGDFYGTTYLGGAIISSTFCSEGCGTVFKITRAGTLTTLYNFCSQPGCSDGFQPFAGLVQGGNGNFYGTTSAGGDLNCNYPYGCGTVFKITVGGTLKTMHSFVGNDGYFPQAGLVQAANGDFYGTTVFGGTINNSCSNNGCGTVFRITPGGTLTTVYNFCHESRSCFTDGANPVAGLIQATDGRFYGTTFDGGAQWGTLFEITPAGKLSTLYTFCAAPTACIDGASPQGGLVQGSNGTLYGTTFFGGSSSSCIYGCGTIFSLAVGLGPFVETRPTIGRTGSRVIILGNNLTGTTSVAFNGTSASFTVVSDTEIKTRVPLGATTGPVVVTTPSGALTSNKNFVVK